MAPNLTVRPLRSTSAVVLLFLTAVATVVGVRPSHAAPGDPFSTVDGAIFIAQGWPTTSLYEVVQEGSNATFELIGASSHLYNAIGFNTNGGTGTALLTMVGFGLLVGTAAAGLWPRRTGVAL